MIGTWEVVITQFKNLQPQVRLIHHRIRVIMTYAVLWVLN
jgi:hypothetical protein